MSKWTTAAVQRIQAVRIQAIDKPKRKAKKDSPHLTEIVNRLLELGIPIIREYKFLEDRRFKFDAALPLFRIAIEWEGGIFSRGRHTRGTGYASDCKKYNLAVMHGWKLLRYTELSTKTEVKTKKGVRYVDNPDWLEFVINQILSVIEGKVNEK